MKTQPKTTQIVSAITAKKRGQTNSNSNKMIPNNTNANKANKRIDRKPRPIYAPCEISGKKNHSIEKCYFGANATNRPPPRNRRPEEQNQVQQRYIRNSSDVNFQAPEQTLN